jgi:uncharacterized protein
MDPTIAEHCDEIAELCRRFRVQRLELFGSAAKGNFISSLSDVDFLVEFESLPVGKHADTYFGLLEALEALFNRSVDLVMVRAIRNRYFLEAIEDSRMLLYAA